MSVSKDIIRQCILDKREEIEQAEIIERPFEFETKGNYVFVGVRHVGKSYMMYQRVKQLLASDIGWDEILFVNFEDERLAEMTAEDLNLLLEVHLETYGKKPYIFLDEVQNIDHWDKFVRRLADAKYQVYVTGSNAKMLSKDVSTTLGGRFFIIDVYPYSFKEFLNAKSIVPKEGWEYSTSGKSEIIKAFNEYFHFGGLPEICHFNAKRSMLSSLYQKIYLSDICNRNSISNERVMNILIKKIAESVKQPQSFNRLKNIVVSTGTRISVPTTIDYIGYAEDGWLLLAIENELAKLADKESTKKYYFIDNGLLNLFLINPETSLLENLTAIHLCRTYGRGNVSYYKTDKEIDFIVNEAKLAIQVSYSIKTAETYDREIAPLKKFSGQHPDWTCMVITYDEEDRLIFDKTSIPVIPIWKWMLQ